MESLVHIEEKSEDGGVTDMFNSSLKVFCLDLDETLIHATRVAYNNIGSKQLKYWGEYVSHCREEELKQLLKDKPSDCLLSDDEYLKSKYGPPLFEDSPDIASPYRWSFPTDDFSKCWMLIRCYNEQHKMTSFYRIEYRPYCQHLIEIINKYKKHCNVKVVISTMATRQYGTLVCEGLKLFKGYLENINGISKPFIDKLVGLEDWKEKCWHQQYPQHYGKKSLPFIGSLFGIDPSDIIAIDDKPQIWTNASQVIYAVPYNGGIYLTPENVNDDKNFKGSNKPTNNSTDNEKNNDIHNSLKINDVLYKIAKYLESYLCHTLGVLSKQRRLSQQYHKKKQLKLQLSNSASHVQQNHNKNENNNQNNNEKNHDVIHTINHGHLCIRNKDIDINTNTLIVV